MALRDLSYSPFEGSLQDGSPPAWVIATNDLSLYWSFRRVKLLMIAIGFFCVPFLIWAVSERFVARMVGGEENIAGLLFYSLGTFQLWVLIGLFAAAGCGTIADDIRYKTIQLYFSKPINALDYVAGKFLSLFLFGSLVTLLPSCIVGGIRLGIYAPQENFIDIAVEFLGLIAFDVLALSVVSLLVMAFSCITARTGLVVLVLLGAMLVPSMISTTAEFIVDQSSWPRLLSISGNARQVLATLVGYGKLETVGSPEIVALMKWASWVILAAIMGAAGGVIHWRTNKLEGIA